MVIGLVFDSAHAFTVGSTGRLGKVDFIAVRQDALLHQERHAIGNGFVDVASAQNADGDFSTLRYHYIAALDVVNIPVNNRLER
ncbi:hypothetical protein D3C77_619250 [compost metagenome]